MGVWRSRSHASAGRRVPSYVEAVTIFEHPDAEREMKELASALHGRGFEVYIHKADAS